MIFTKEKSKVSIFFEGWWILMRTDQKSVIVLLYDSGIWKKNGPDVLKFKMVKYNSFFTFWIEH